jgi:hypothetical protein
VFGGISFRVRNNFLEKIFLMLAPTRCAGL